MQPTRPTSSVVSRATSSPWHAGEREAQLRAGFAGSSGGAIRAAMPDQHRAFFAQLPYVIVGSIEPRRHSAALTSGGKPRPSIDAGAPVAAIWTGAPGFVTTPDPETLELAVALDPADPASPAFTPGAPFGLLGIELPTRRRNRANGTIVAVAPDRITVAVHQSFGNCPQYIHPRELRPTAAVPAPTTQLTALDDAARAAIRRADTFFVATAARLDEPTGGVDVSHRGGPAGFVRVAGDVLTIPDYRGNRYFNTLGNLVSQPRAALLFADFASGDLLHLQGTTEIAWHPDEALPGAERLWRLHVDHAWRRPGALALRTS